jgi:S-(hydroxymethyl)glutathione dehydrogenase / alcohol dehydrogenase
VRAAVYVPGADDLVVETLTPLTAGPRDVVVQVAASGVCHSDQAVIDGKRLGPIVLGHEATGTVEWTGPEVTRVRPGDRVILSLTPVCGRCWYCVRNETHLCDRNAEMLPRMRATRADGAEVNALAGIGSFADVITVDEASCVQVHTDLPADQLSLIGCGFTTGFGAAVNTADVHPGATVAVIGAGGVGTAAVLGAHVAGAARIVVVDPVPMKRESAQRFGATDVVDPADGDPVEQVRAITGSRGVDFAFEAVGSHALELQALQMTRRGGTTVFVGIPGFTRTLELPSMQMIMEDRTIKGCYYGSARVMRDFPRFIELIESGRLDVASMVTRHYPLDDVNAAFTAMLAGEVVRSVVVPA